MSSSRGGAAQVLTGNAARLVLGAIGTIAIAAIIGPSEKGLLATLIVIATITSTVVSLGMDGAIRYYLATSNWSLAESNAVSIGLTIVAAVLSYAGFVLWRQVGPGKLLRGLTDIQLATATAVVLLGMFAGQALLARRGFKLYSILAALAALANPAFFVLLIWAGQTQLNSALWAWIAAQAVVAIPAQFALLRDSQWSLARPSDPRGAIWYGFRSLGWDVLNLVNLRLDILMLRLLSTPAATGGYALSTQFTEVVWLLPTSVGVAVFPEIAEGGEEHEHGKWTARVCRLTTALSLVLAVVVGLGATLLIVVALPAYRIAIPALWLLLPGTAVASASKILSHDLNARGNPQASLAAAGVGVVITIVGDLALVPVLGATGAALISTASYIIYTILLVWFFVRMTGSPALDVVPRKADVLEAAHLSIRTVREYLNRTPAGDVS
jgi:stage V sporulation protein B